MHLDEKCNVVSTSAPDAFLEINREHLWRLGSTTRPHELAGDQLRGARDLHLRTLQNMCDRSDFGEPLKGRI